MQRGTPPFRLGRWIVAFIAGIFAADVAALNLPFSFSLCLGLLSLAGLTRLPLPLGWLWSALAASALFCFGISVHSHNTVIRWQGYGADRLMVRQVSGWDSGWSFSCMAIVLDGQNNGAKIRLEASPQKPGSDYGDILHIEGRSSAFYEPVYPYAFRAATFWRHRGVSARFRAVEIAVVDSTSGVQVALNRYRSRVRESIHQWPLSLRARAFYSALLAGDDSQLDDEDREAFAQTGLVHLLSVSGMHVGIIEALLGFLLIQRWFARKHWLRTFRLILIFAGLWCFVLLSGAGPAVVRAGIMFTLIRWARHGGRPGQASEAAWISAFLALMYDSHLLWNIGFQLSYLAVFGIVYGHAAWDRRYIRHQNKWKRYTLGALSVSFWAQLFTSPLSVFYFHRFPNYFLLTNLLMLPFVPPLLFAGMGLALLWVLGYRSGIVWEWMDWAVDLYYRSIITFANLPGSTLENLYPAAGRVLFIALAILILTWTLWKKKWLGYWLCLMAILTAMNIQPGHETGESWIHIYRGMTVLEMHHQNKAELWIAEEDWRLPLFLRDSKGWRIALGIDTLAIDSARLPPGISIFDRDTFFVLDQPPAQGRHDLLFQQ